MQQNRFQFEFYALFLMFIRYKREEFWRPVLRRIRKGELSPFEERVRDKFPKCWAELIRLSRQAYSQKVNNRANVEYFRDFGRAIKRHSKVRRFVVFLMAYEGQHGLYDKYGPFRKIGNKWKINAPYVHFFLSNFRRFNQIYKDLGISLTWVLIPGGYGELPFRNSVEGVGTPWTMKARPYIQKFFRTLKTIMVDVWHSKKLHMQGSNEVGHLSHADGVEKKLQHEAFYESWQPFIPLKRWDSDLTKSDFMALAEREWFGVMLDEDGKEVETIECKADYLRLKAEGRWVRTIRIMGKDEYDRLNFIKKNSQGKDIEESDTWIGIGWKKFIASTDGNDKGSGELYCGEGPFVNLNYNELGEMIDNAEALEDEHGLVVIVSDLPKEVFAKNADGIAEEDLSLINLQRIEVIPTKMGMD